MMPKLPYTQALASARWITILLAIGLSAQLGCTRPLVASKKSIPCFDVPRELDKATLPAYRIEPPDILSIDVVQQIAESEYLLHTGDMLMVTVTGTLPDEPIAGIYPIEPGGVIQFGFSYGSVEIAGMTIEDARGEIEARLRKVLRSPQVTLAIRSVAGIQRISGEHMVGPDGTVTLGKYGSVSVVGQTLQEAQYTLCDHLSPYFSDPEVSISVYSYNSKVYYVVTQGGGLGDNLVRIPYTGNETVMDAISNVNGLSHVSSTRMWIARPGRNAGGENQILPVDWLGITQRGEVETNYQILPGDRLYIAHDRMVAFDGRLGKITAPFERIFGFTLLGTTTASRLSGRVLHKTPGNTYNDFVPRP
jgi:polysaccharide biosynthesis/export protein